MPHQPPLPDELVEEVLLRLPPENPAGLVRAGLVSSRWCRLVSDPGFHRRFRDFHRSPPMLGMLCTLDDPLGFRFEATIAFCSPHADRRYWRVLDARHGRVLLLGSGRVFVVWNPITDEVRELPLPPHTYCFSRTAAVLCAAASCNHLDCHNGPFLVVLVRFDTLTFVHTYSSNAAAWSEPVSAQQNYFPDRDSWMPSALVGKALYIGNQKMESTAIKYDLESRQLSLVHLPFLLWGCLLESLTTTEDGRLGLIRRDDSKLYMWSRKDAQEVDAKWERRVIELKTVFPVDVDVTKLRVIGSCVSIIFMKTGNEVYAVDVKTYKVKKVYEGEIHTILPYMSFYTPVLRVPTTGEGASAGASIGEQT